MISIGPNQYGTLLLFGFLYSLIFPYIFWKYRYEKSVKWFVIGSSLAGIWMTAEGLFVVLSDETMSSVILWLVRYIGATVSVCMFVFVIEYTRGYDLSNRKVLIFFLPLIVLHIYVLLTPNSLFSEITYYDSYADWEYNIYGNIHFIYVVALHLIAIGNLALEVIANTGIKRKQTSVILSGYVAGVIPGLLTGLDFFPKYLNPTLLSVSVTLVIMSYGLKRYDTFSANAVSNSNFMSRIEEGIVIYNEENLVTEYNKTATQILGTISVGDDIYEVCESNESVTDLLYGKEESVTVESDEKKYDAQNYGMESGKSILIFRDNTEMYDKTERLSMIRKIHNRIFRHNVRNELTVVRGHSKIIEQNLQDEEKIKKSCKKVQDATERLIDINDKTSSINEVITGTEETKEYRIHNLVERKIEYVDDQFDDFDSILNVEQDITVEAHKMLPLAIENILENSVKHNDNTTIRISTDTSDKTVTIRFEDTGNGISPDEYTPVIDGDITELKHASSSGLWLIKWIVEYASPMGHYSIENTDNGTKTSITLKKSDDGV